MQKTTLLFDEKEMKEPSIFDGVSRASSAAMHSRGWCAGARALRERFRVIEVCGAAWYTKKDVFGSQSMALVYSGRWECYSYQAEGFQMRHVKEIL